MGAASCDLGCGLHVNELGTDRAWGGPPATPCCPLGRNTWRPTTGERQDRHPQPVLGTDREAQGGDPSSPAPQGPLSIPMYGLPAGPSHHASSSPGSSYRTPKEGSGGVPLQHLWPPTAGPGTSSGTGRTQADGQPPTSPSTSPSVSPSTGPSALWVTAPRQETQRPRPELWALGKQHAGSQNPGRATGTPSPAGGLAPPSPTPSPPHGPLSPS